MHLKFSNSKQGRRCLQTNAIIYCTGRLQPIAGTKATWQVYKGANGACVMNTAAQVRISMDGKGRALDNVFVERLWRSLRFGCSFGPIYPWCRMGP